MGQSAILSAQDHLHIRGEHVFCEPAMVSIKGSPPHTWRTRQQMRSDLKFNTITSTYVENTVEGMWWSATIQDHLHIRGEHVFCEPAMVSIKGSPPHTWRTPMLIGLKLACMRITSTYVENTRTALLQTWLKRDHLHLRGEHYLHMHVQMLLQGSPPLTWRTLNRTSIRQGRKRITSTYVENTLKDPYNKAIL